MTNPRQTTQPPSGADRVEPPALSSAALRAFMTWFVLTGFIGGTLLVPALHLAFHALPHDHVGGGVRFHLAAATDVDDDVHDERPKSQRTPHRHRRVPRSEPLDTKHGEHSFAHFSLALNDGVASTLLVDLALLPRSESVLPARLLLPPSIDRFSDATRGPPPA